MRNTLLGVLGAALVLATVSPALADEGMWTFNGFPADMVKKKYDVTIDQAWLDKVQKGTVRFNSGGTGSFVSADGLVMTNHHVGADCIRKMSSKDEDLDATGFYAPTRDKERACPDLELNVLMEITDVSDRVEGAAAKLTDPEAAEKARRAEMASIEKACVDASGDRCDVVTLYNGGAYNLYRYKKYTDVRLVWAPEFLVAFFGGHQDNFTYPRYDIDVSFFHVYENDAPVKPVSFLHLSETGPKNAEPVFVSGNPGNTDRLNTSAQLKTMRDTIHPFTKKLVDLRIKQLEQFGAQGAEQRRISSNATFGWKNYQKALTGFSAGLADERIFNRHKAAEDEFRKRVAANPELQKKYGSAWDEIAKAEQDYARWVIEADVVEGGRESTLYGIAHTIVRYVDEVQKPSGERLREYRETALPSLHQRLYSKAPIYKDYETARLTWWLESLRDELGPDHPLVKKVLGRKSPAKVARKVIHKTKLDDVSQRQLLIAGGPSAVRSSRDPLIRLALQIEPYARELRDRSERYDAIIETQSGRIAAARRAVYGTSGYPDATFTLRLSIGSVKGYQENGKDIPYQTDFNGLYAKYTGKDPYDLPKRFLDAKDRVDGSVGVDFVSTNDIIGGNSGSPVVNAAGDVVGIIFDGNIQSLVWRYVYDDTMARAVSVHSAGIYEALDEIYGATALVNELHGKATEPKKGAEEARAPN